MTSEAADNTQNQSVSSQRQRVQSMYGHDQNVTYPLTPKIKSQGKRKPKSRHKSQPAIDALYLARPYPINVDSSWRKIKLYLYKFHWRKIFAHHKMTNAFYTFTNSKYNKIKQLQLHSKTKKRVNLSKGVLVWVFVKGKLHILGGIRDDMFHIVFDSTIKSFTSQHVHEFTAWSAGNSSPALIHVKSKNELLLLGGHGYRFQDGIWQCKLDGNKSERAQLWNKLLMKLPRNNSSDFRYLLTNNDRFIICINSRDSHIFYWEIDGGIDEWNISSIDWDIEGTPTHFVMTGDIEYDFKIVNGFIRNITRNTVIMEVIEDYSKQIVNEIMKWFCIEELHVFDFGSMVDVHWKCDIQQIIPSYKDGLNVSMDSL